MRRYEAYDEPNVANGADSSGPQGRDASTRLLSFLIADVRGYTRFTHEHGDEEAARLAARFAQLARKRIEDHGGELLELRGDEALGVFASAREALLAAVDLQRSFRERTDGEPALPLSVGIGLDAGEAVPVEGGYRGGALNLAARLCSRAGPGEILASETVVALARRVEGIRFEQRGVQRLKGLDEPVKVIEVVSETPLPRVPVSRWAALRRFRRKHVTRRKAWAATGVALVGAASAVLAVVALGGTGAIANDDAPTRVALAGPFRVDDPGPSLSLAREGFLRAARTYDLETEIIGFDELDESPRAVGKVRKRIEDGDFDLVIWSGPSAVAITIAREAEKHPDTHFVYLETDLEELEAYVRGIELVGVPNVTGVSLLDGSASYLGGYLAALVSKSGVVSVVGGVEGVVIRLVQRFTEGAEAARPGVEVRVDYSDSFVDQDACDRIANRQIDDRADVVFAAAGQCGLGALEAASIRGVWGVGVDRDQSYLGPHILASVVKRFDRVIELVVRRFLEGELPAGKTVELGMREDAVGIVGINDAVSADIRKKLSRQVAFVR
jgi:basic membrane lipoprotein Med (substrate-binding protein (PBP1-ABC) superfamily)/class 3 adenylate cyclase